jgi:hypothetical protein
MNNLTPLQEVASRIYAAKISASFYIEPDEYSLRDGKSSFYDYKPIKLLSEAIYEAKALLEATKPEPLEWVYEVEYHSKGGEFVIVEGEHLSGEDSPAYFIKYSSNNLPDNENAISWFCDLEKAKQFAEFIRTR